MGKSRGENFTRSAAIVTRTSGQFVRAPERRFQGGGGGGGRKAERGRKHIYLLLREDAPYNAGDYANPAKERERDVLNTH